MIRQVDLKVTDIHMLVGETDWLARFHASGKALDAQEALRRYPPALRLLAPQLAGTVPSALYSDPPLPLIVAGHDSSAWNIQPAELDCRWVTTGSLAMIDDRPHYPTSVLHFESGKLCLTDDFTYETMTIDIVSILEHTLRAFKLTPQEFSRKPAHLQPNTLWYSYDALGYFECNPQQMISIADSDWEPINEYYGTKAQAFTTPFDAISDLTAELSMRARQSKLDALARREGKRKMDARIAQNRRDAEERKKEPCSICQDAILSELKSKGTLAITVPCNHRFCLDCIMACVQVWQALDVPSPIPNLVSPHRTSYLLVCVCPQRKRECPICRQTIIEIHNGNITHKMADLFPEAVAQDAARESNAADFVLMNDGTYLPHSDFVPCACCGQITDEDGEAFSAIQCDGILPDGGVCNRSYCWDCVGIDEDSVPQGAWIGPCCRPPSSDASDDDLPVRRPRQRRRIVISPQSSPSSSR